MKIFKVCMFLLAAPTCLMSQVLFEGLVESAGITKNTFLCPVGAGALQGCVDSQAAAHGFDISGGNTIQFVNNQAYWLQQEAIHAQYLSTVKKITGTALENKLKEDGWKSMGGYCVVISSDPILTEFVMRNVTAKPGQTKVVAQLWYNGSDVIQLWSQDAKILSAGQSFKVSISNDADSRLKSIGSAQSSQMSSNAIASAATANAAATGSSTARGSTSEQSLLAAPSVAPVDAKSWKDAFLSSLQLQPNNRFQTDYDDAASCPRQVRITK